MHPETLIEILEDVRHDLGKHLVLPLRLLPKGAHADSVHQAASTALLRTRRGPAGVTDAQSLWAAFRSELTQALETPLASAGPLWVGLEAAVHRALAWRDRLADPTLDRAALTADLAAVSGAVDRVLATLEPAERPVLEELP